MKRTFIGTVLVFLVTSAPPALASAPAAGHDEAAAHGDAHPPATPHEAPRPKKKKSAHPPSSAAAPPTTASGAAHADADGTFTIQLDDDNAPAGAPSGDLDRSRAKPTAAAGKKADAHGAKADAHGAKADAHGAKADAHGAKADAHAAKADAHGAKADAHGAKADAHGAKADAHGGKADAHGEDPEADDGDDEVDEEGETTHELIPAPPKPKRRPRDWKPLAGTGFSDARKNKWGVVEAVPPAIAARARMGFRGDEIQFPDRVHFTRDSIRFAAGADDVLARIAEQLQASPEIATLWIEGHTDFDGSEAYNQKLSEARASAVREALVRLGVAPERLVAYGFGESRPAVGGRKGAKDHENRRVVFRLVQADRPALQTRQAVEFGQAAVVGVWGPARWRLSALAGPPHGAHPVPAGALARRSAGGHGETAADAEPNFAAESEGAAAPQPSVGNGPEEEQTEGGWRPLEFRTQLPEGAVVETASGARVLLRLPDLSRVLVEPDSRLALTKLYHSQRENKSYTSARLETGAIAVAANPDERGVSTSIWSFGGGAIELTSADFEMRVSGSGAAVAVLRGSASASTGGASSIRLGAGERLEPGGTSVQPMLPRPEAVAPLTGTVPEARLSWQPVTGSARYRLEVAEDISFLQPARVEVVDGQALELAGLDAGRTWYWRVRASDAAGVLGRPSRIHAFRLGPAAPAPLPAATPAAAPAASH
jgi:outer membrane protein OmpA-like peptidoglycan-associated protein